jgi:hypothetical protein
MVLTVPTHWSRTPVFMFGTFKNENAGVKSMVPWSSSFSAGILARNVVEAAAVSAGTARGCRISGL